MRNPLDHLYISYNDLYASTLREIAYDVYFSGEDLKPVPNVKEADSLSVYINSYPGEGENAYTCHVELAGTITLVSHGKEEPFEIRTDDYFEFSDDSENTDVMPEKNRFDILPVLKAVFYDAVPRMEDEDYERDGGDTYTLMSEEEYAASKKGEDGEEEDTYRPFADLKKELREKNRKEKDQ
jgi:hypothetical protein